MRPSLRALVVTVVVAVALLPVPVVALLGALGDAREARIERAVRAAAREAVARMDRGEDPAAFAAHIARARRVRLRVLAADGRALADEDRDERVATYGPVTSVAGAEGEDVRGFERERGSVATRESFRAALQGAASAGCVSREGGALRVCESVVATRDRGRVVHAQRSATSAAQRLATHPQPLWWLTAFVSLSGLALAAWLLARIVRPLDALRAALSERAASPRLATQPIALSAPPEIAEVVRAHNGVLAALAAERRAKETLAADLVHEIKSPLAAIRLALDPLGADAGGAAEAVKRIDRTVGSLLELSRAEAGLAGELREDVPLRTLVEGVCSTLAPRPDVTLRIGGADPVVRVASEALCRAVACLVDNARSFATSAVDVRVEVDGEHARLIVEDDGPGIAPDVLPRVFERFFSARRERGGTGIGLALARAVAEAHGGSVSAESPPGAGARFTMGLPRTR